MSYQVLARKWRPRKFAELVGQTHVVQPLSHALANGLVHHAFLFTGTRGVGKTTLARLFAKALNCLEGVSAEPCGQCAACQAIEQGRFVDLIEIDAASRTKVEDTRDLLDNVQYVPSQGRYKVYLIDEVHMLSRHSFNALLKTLEEPPPHVKFILATTDPQRLPATILSRCLQFNLKRLPERLIADRLSHILTQENVAYEPAAVNLLARAGDGSLRDALTLLDQAIAFAGGQVAAADVHTMLGTIDSHHAVHFLELIAAGDAGALLHHVAVLDDRAPDYGQLLGELLTGLQRIAVMQMVPTAAVHDDDSNAETLQRLAETTTPEDIQLYYQIALLGRRDLPLAVDARSGFEMLLLRMLCFSPLPPAVQAPAPTVSHVPSPPKPAGVKAAEANDDPVAQAPPPPSTTQTASAHQVVDPQADWGGLVSHLSLSGLANQLARHCSVAEWQNNILTLRLAPTHQGLATDRLIESLRVALCQHLGSELKIRVVFGQPEQTTLAQQDAARQAESQRDAEQLINQDPNVRALQETFNAQLRPESVRPWPDSSQHSSAPDTPKQ
jgi:DNA polymerase-3 subunit gamma/tau